MIDPVGPMVQHKLTSRLQCLHVTQNRHKVFTNNIVHDTEYIDLLLLGGHKKQQTRITRLRDYFSPPNVLQLCIIIPLISGSSHCAMGSIVF